MAARFRGTRATVTAERAVRRGCEFLLYLAVRNFGSVLFHQPV